KPLAYSVLLDIEKFNRVIDPYVFSYAYAIKPVSLPVLEPIAFGCSDQETMEQMMARKAHEDVSLGAKISLVSTTTKMPLKLRDTPTRYETPRPIDGTGGSAFLADTLYALEAPGATGGVALQVPDVVRTPPLAQVTLPAIF